MDLTTYSSPAAFLAAAQDYLEEHETFTPIILGNTLRLAQKESASEIYLATVSSARGIELIAFMTPPHRLVLWSHQPAPGEAIDLLARQLHTESRLVPGVVGPPELARAWMDRWQALTGCSSRLFLELGIYKLTEVVPPPPAPGSLRLAEPTDLPLMSRWVLEFEQEALSEGSLEQAQALAQSRIADQSLYIWEHEQPVSMLASSRPTRRGITVNMVYTPPQFRRRGYAMAAVAQLSQQLLDSGRDYCTLFTDLGNPTSNSIYQKVGYQPVGEFHEYLVVDQDHQQG